MVEGEYHRAFAIMKLNEDYSNPENVTLEKDRKSTRLNSSHEIPSRMPSSA